MLPANQIYNKSFTFTPDYNPGKSILTKMGWSIASHIDQLFSLRPMISIIATVESKKKHTVINQDLGIGKKIEGKDGEDVTDQNINGNYCDFSFISTLMKVTAIAVTFFYFPLPTLATTAIALAIKGIYRKLINDSIDSFFEKCFKEIEDPNHPNWVSSPEETSSGETSSSKISSSQVPMKTDALNKVIKTVQIGNNTLVLATGDITKETTDFIVNAANTKLEAGGGVCGAIHAAAGNEPFDQCKEFLKAKEIKKIQCGQAVRTGSGKLYPKIKGIVHAAGPNFANSQEKANGPSLLAEAYLNSLHAVFMYPNSPLHSILGWDGESEIKSISFPSISTSIFAYPLDEAALIALRTVKNFLRTEEQEREVRFVFLPTSNDAKTLPAYLKALEELEKEEEACLQLIQEAEADFNKGNNICNLHNSAFSKGGPLETLRSLIKLEHPEWQVLMPSPLGNTIDILCDQKAKI